MGTWRRLIVVPCTQTPKVEDPQLGAKLQAELAGIFNWALSGARELNAAGRFELPPEIVDAVNEFRRQRSR